MPDTTRHRTVGHFRLSLTDLADPRDVRHTLQETSYLGLLVAPDVDAAALERAFDAAARLHTGNYADFPAGSDGFRRLETACATTLAAMRLMHGAHVMGHGFAPREALLLALAALFHDPGDGRGGPAVGNPAFALDHLVMDGFSRAEAEDCAALIRCADAEWMPGQHGGAPGAIPEDDAEMGGCLLATAVVLAEITDRRRFEQIAFHCLHTGETQSARQALDYIGRVAVRRLHRGLGSVHTLMLPHFGNRWGLDRDLYMETARETREMLAAALERVAAGDAALS